MKTKFTPGPWEDQGEDHFADMPFVRVGKGHRPIADAIPPIDLVDLDEETRANASLIAAAPELYEALYLCWDALRVYAPDYMHGLPKERYVMDAYAALAKARGES